MDKIQLHYLEQLSEMYPTIGNASTEIINLQAILNLPKGTEHFCRMCMVNMMHFRMSLRTDQVRYAKIDDVFGGTLSSEDKSGLATLIYYPREKMELVRKKKKI